MIRDTLIQAAQQMRLEIPEEQIRAFELFAMELKKWNRKINLTSIITDQEIAVKHIIDSLCLTRLISSRHSVLDVGSGAGIPAIPLKIARPDVTVVSVDAVGKKIHFQRHIARLLRLQNFEALHSRIESLCTTHAQRFDVITSRAFSDLEQFVRLTGALLADGGVLIAMKGPAASTELESARTVLRSLQFELGSIDHYTLPFENGERCLITIKRSQNNNPTAHF
ncbi:MAG: 16S rRNA (guanine(527)-N(7))-methyltransferase RsmG [Desulfuromonadales bacterium]|nr:16S rRNA (guanine(527)-N(7))-methyltransferase RsmG [Desulfuromonadales bacterium]